MAITLDPIEFTLIISITPINIAINAIARAKVLLLQAVVNAVAEKLVLTRLAHRELLEKQLELLIKLVTP